jgi:serine protease Do
MKTITQKIIPFGFGVLAALPAFAIEPPRDDAPPPPSVKSPASTPTADPAPKAEADIPAEKETPVSKDAPVENEAENKVAFIGLITAEIPEILAAHLNTNEGEGVLIRNLLPGGPAEKAGFVRYDVITRVGGRSVGSPEQLSKQIASYKPGDEVAIDYIHAGKPESKTVKLDARPTGTGKIVDPRQLGHLDLDGMPDDQADRLRDMIERRMNGFMREPDALNDLFKEKNGNNFQFKSDATFRLMDNEGSVEMKSSDGAKEMTVRDKQNNITWSGPWDTEQDKAAAPPGVRERIERFKFDEGIRGGGFRFRLGPDRDNKDEIDKNEIR